MIINEKELKEFIIVLKQNGAHNEIVKLILKNHMQQFVEKALKELEN